MIRNRNRIEIYLILILITVPLYGDILEHVPDTNQNDDQNSKTYVLPFWPIMKKEIPHDECDSYGDE